MMRASCRNESLCTPGPDRRSLEVQHNDHEMCKHQDCGHHNERDSISSCQVPGNDGIGDSECRKVLGAIEDHQDCVSACLVDVQEVGVDDAVGADEPKQV